MLAKASFPCGFSIKVTLGVFGDAQKLRQDKEKVVTLDDAYDGQDEGAGSDGKKLGDNGERNHGRGGGSRAVSEVIGEEGYTMVEIEVKA